MYIGQPFIDIFHSGLVIFQMKLLPQYIKKLIINSNIVVKMNIPCVKNKRKSMQNKSFLCLTIK